MKILLVLAKILRSRAKLIGITQAPLGQSAGVSRRTMGHVFRGERDFKVSTLMSVADALSFEVILVPKDAAQAMSAFEGFETHQSVIKTSVQRALESVNIQAKQE